MSKRTRRNHSAPFKAKMALAAVIRQLALENDFLSGTLGRLCLGARKINLSAAFAGQSVGLREVSEKVWMVSFMHYDLGFFDHQPNRVECAPIPSVPECYPCLGYKPSPM
jgi:hypothetical protein